ncbi:MAG: Ig-like domain-containing protein, partial [Anaerolineae bacterium]|nr:Ig-like domain-containing protein [Anaerolineae bacterium]
MKPNRRLVVFITLFLLIFTVGITIQVVAQTIADLRATNTARLAVDNNNNGLADGGDVIEYTVNIANCSPNVISGMTYQSDIDPNTVLIPSSVQVTIQGTGLCGDTSAPPTAPPPPPVNADAVDDAFTITNGATNTETILTNDTGEAPITVLTFGGPLVANVGDNPADGVTAYIAPSGIIYTLDSAGNLTIDASSLAIGASGTDTLFYQIQANNGTTDTAQITITYGDFPTAVDDTYSVAQSGVLNDDLASNDTLGTPAATVVSFGGGSLGGTSNTPNTITPLPGYPDGSLTVNTDGTFSFTAPATFTGTFTFDYTLDNGIGTSTATVTIDALAAPIAQNDAITVSIGIVNNLPAPTLFNDNGSGADNLGVPPATITTFGGGSLGGAVGDNVAGATVVIPASGGISLTINADGSIVIDATAGGSVPGTYTVQYQLDNSIPPTSSATVTINVVQGPVAQDDTFTVLVTGTLNGDLTADNGAGVDILGTPPYNTLTFGGGNLGGTITSNNAPASLSLAGGTLTVNLDGTFSLSNPTSTGIFSFQYRLSNTIPASDDATVTITVQQAPFAQNDTYVMNTGATLTITTADTNDLLDNDSLGVPPATIISFGGGNLGGDQTSYAANSTQPFSVVGGSVTVNADGSITIVAPTTPNTYTFIYRIDNGVGFSDAFVFIDVQQIPTAQDDTFNTGYTQDVSGYSISGNLTNDNGAGVDILGSPTATITNFGVLGAIPPTNVAFAGGLITIDNAGVFTLTNADPGTHSFIYTLDNGVGSDTATVTFIVDAPIIVSSTNPANGVNSVTLNSDVVITFSDVPQLNGSWFTIVCTTSNITTANSGVNLVGNMVTINPNTDFLTGETCTVTVLSSAANGVTDADAFDAPDLLDGDNDGTTGDNYTFTFITSDSLPELTLAEVEQAGFVNVAVTSTQIANNTDIRLTFDETVTFAGGAYSVVCSTSGDVTASYSASATPASIVTLTYGGAGLADGEVCTVTLVSTQITDTDGLPPAQLDGDGDNIQDGSPADDEIFTFTVDNAPSVNSTTPADGAINVPLATNLVINFSEPVNFSGTTTTLDCGAGAIAYTITGDGTATITLDPTPATLPVNAPCVLTIAAGDVTDVDAGDPPNNMAANVVVNFTTVDDAPPTVLLTAPLDGAIGVTTTTDISITFSENVDINIAGFSLNCAGAIGFTPALPTSATPNITFTPSSALPANTLCTVTLLAVSITDQDGPADQLDGDNNGTGGDNYVFTFTTDGAPAVINTVPNNGATGVISTANI